VQSWLDRFPERVGYERAELERLGFEIDAFELERNRRLVLRGTVATVRGPLPVTIVYPDTFPYLRPEVYATETRLERHHNAYDGNLCLLDRSSAQWQVDDTGAWLISQRVPYLVDVLEAGGEELLQAEVPQGEPASTYFRGERGTAVFVPDEALRLDASEREGRLELSAGSREALNPALRVLLRRVTARGDRHGRVLADADDRLNERFDGQALTGRWVRLERLPDDNTPQALLAAAAAVSPSVTAPRFQRVGDAQVDVVGCVFSEEVEQGQFEDGWLFVVRVRQPVGPRRHREGTLVVRGERLSRSDLFARVPGLRRLEDKRVALLGLGGLGAPIALELARSGLGSLTVCDSGMVEVGNTVRWPFGLSAVGHSKTDVVATWIDREYPYTSVRALEGRVGLTEPPAQLGRERARSELDVLEEFFAEADLVIDATAELGVQHLVSTLAADRPQLVVTATEGAAGGLVARVGGQRGCWMCLQHALDDGTVPLPPSEPQATVQPRGCASVTFTGSSFDLAAVANQAVRVAVATLLGYDDAHQDVSVLSLHENTEALPAPRWHSQPLSPHPACVACSSAHAA